MRIRTLSSSDEQRLRELWNSGLRPKAIAAAMGWTRGQVEGWGMRLNLQYAQKPARNYRDTTPGVRNARTFFPRRVQDPGTQNVLKPGWYQRKLGDRVYKGRWKNMPFYALTLEERATCPRSCALWVNCYGNGMSRAVRYRPGEALIDALTMELRYLNAIHHRGFVVRLHILGDFYSLDYVAFWERALKRLPNLRIFGYTARGLEDPIGRELARIRDENWDRFALRTSGAVDGPRTLVIDRVEDAPAGAIVCPVETGKTRSCGTCGLCWNTKKPIAFVRH